jgi:CHAD domain-containing protein
MGKQKWIEGLDCDAAARAGIAFVLRAKLDEMCALRDAALDFSDIEGVHKMRVASRRLRSALRDFQPYLERAVSPDRLKAVARALGRVRDEDVAIEMMEGLIEEADEEAREGIRRLAFKRRARRDEARAALISAVGDAALTELREKFNSQLERASAEPRRKSGRAVPKGEGDGAAGSDGAAGVVAAVEAVESVGTAAVVVVAIKGDGGGGAAKIVEAVGAVGAPEAGAEAGADRQEGPRFSDVGGRIVRARFRELREAGRSLYRPFDVEPLHEMRIRAKRLRYAVELFEQCWGEPVAPFASEIAKMQEYLGDLHDCDVWIEELGRRLRRRSKRAARTAHEAAERRAASWLLRHFSKARARHYAKALALWDSWESMNFAAILDASVEEARARSHAVAAVGEQAAAKVD